MDCSNKTSANTEPVTSLYALHEKFQKIYHFIFNKNNDSDQSGYLCIDET